MTTTKMLPARGNESRLAATTSQMEESEAKQWLQEALALFSDIAQAYGQERTNLLLFLPIAKQLNRARPMSGDARQSDCRFSFGNETALIYLWQVAEKIRS
jgi:hypothetical protein